MLTLLKNWEGTLNINGVDYENATSVKETFSGPVHILLQPKQVKPQNESSSAPKNVKPEPDEVTITVKQYMTRKASPEFDFMEKWNNDNPMPLRTMTGTIEKETRGMVYMHLHGFGKPTITCLCCGKELTNPISRHYGIGPVCLSKMGISRDIEDVDGIKEDLAKLEWTGWIIKSAITEQEEVQDEI